MKSRNSEGILRIGTDCSGIESPICALNNLGIDYEHVFSCEIDKYARKTIEANYKPSIIYEDIRTNKIVENLDIYVAGPPCQSYSYSGLRKGIEDIRGTIFNEVIRTIGIIKPKVFIIENVIGLLTIHNGEYWKFITSQLEELENYSIYYKILNTKDYGIPQNRQRVFIVGINNNHYLGNFKFPEKIESRNIKEFIDYSVVSKNRPPIRKQEVLETLRKSKATFLNLGWQNFKENSYEHYSPCIVAQASMWCVPLNRKCTVKELLALQGFPKDFKQVVSDTQFKKQIGNSMSVNVLEKLFIEIFKVVKL